MPPYTNPADYFMRITNILDVKLELEQKRKLEGGQSAVKYYMTPEEEKALMDDVKVKFKERVVHMTQSYVA